jgi:hypothetical protein
MSQDISIVVIALNSKEIGHSKEIPFLKDVIFVFVLGLTARLSEHMVTVNWILEILSFTLLNVFDPVLTTWLLRIFRIFRLRLIHIGLHNTGSFIYDIETFI